MTDYPFKIGEWQEETIEIATVEPVVNEKGQVVGKKDGVRHVPQKVLYSKLSDPVKVSCNDLEHTWYIPDRHNHVAFCRNCKVRKFIHAVVEKVVDGKILNRDTDLQIA